MSDGWPPRKRRVEISDDFWDDPRVLKAGNAAVGLYVLSLYWLSQRHLSDHPEYLIDRYTVEYEISTVRQPLRLARRLEDAGMWRRLTRGRRLIVGWILVQDDVKPLWRFAPRREYIPPALREMVIERDGRTCQLCGQPVTDQQVLHIDHIWPVSKGGRSVLRNLQVAHSTCNIRKGARV